MLHYVDQLAPDCVCLQFGAGQVAYSGFLEPFLLKTASCYGWKDYSSFICQAFVAKGMEQSRARIKALIHTENHPAKDACTHW